MATVAEVEALLKARDEMSKVLNKAQQNAKTETGKIGSHFERMAERAKRAGAGMQSAGKSLTRSVTLPLLAAGAAAVSLANKQADAEAKLQSSFDSMGAAAWTNTAALKANAAAIQSISTFGDEAVIDMQAVLLTFGDVTNQVGEGNDVFDKATMSIVDLSAKMGQDLQQSAVMVGKALNDPIAGLTAMRRVGIQFTKQQEDQIKVMAESGDKLGAQKIILAELERQFGGTAEQMAGTDAGKMKQAMNTLGDSAESAGRIITPVLVKLSGALKSLAAWFENLTPGQKEMVVRMAAIAAAVGPVLFILGKLVSSFGLVMRAFSAMSTLMMANPWLLLIAAVIALTVLIIANWDKIKAFLFETWEQIKRGASNIWNSITGFFTGTFDKIKELAAGAANWVRDRFNALVDFFTGMPGRIGRAIGGVANLITSPFKAAFNAIAKLWNNTVGKLKFEIPGWVPGIGGNKFNVPQIPTFHEGGTFRAPPGQREGLALLEDGETVTPAGGGGVTHNWYISQPIDAAAVFDLAAWKMRTAGT